MLERLRLTPKLFLLVGAPLGVLLFFPPSAVVGAWVELRRLSEHASVVDAVESSIELVAGLQAERGLTSVRAGGGDVGVVERLAGQRDRVDRMCGELLRDLLDEKGFRLLGLRAVTARNCESLAGLRGLSEGSSPVETFEEYTRRIEDGIRATVLAAASSEVDSSAGRVEQLDLLLLAMEMAGRTRGALSGPVSSFYEAAEVRAWIRTEEEAVSALGDVGSSSRILGLPKELEVEGFRQERARLLSRLSKSRLRSRLVELLGYGGLIHDFKDYVLRGAPSYRSEFLEGRDAIREVLGEYGGELSTPAEQESVQAILGVVEAYGSRLAVVDRGHREGWSADRIDAAVRVDDSAALAALDRLEAATGADAVEWFERATRRIGVLRTAQRDLLEELREEIDGAIADQRSRASGALLALVTAVLLGTALAAVVGRHLQSRARALEAVAERIETTGDPGRPVDVGGRDEFARLAAALSRMGREVARREEALRRQSSELEQRVSERTAELELERSLLQGYLDGSSELVQSVNADGAILYVNRAWVQTLGYRRDDVIGLNVRDLVHTSARQRMVSLLSESVLGDGDVEADGIAFETRAGDLVELRGRLVPYRDPRSGEMRVRCYLSDVSALQRLSADLSDQERLLRDFAAVSRQVFWIFDLGREAFVFVNQACEEITGFPPRTFLDDPRAWLDLVDERDSEALDALVEAAIRGEPGVLEHRIRNAAGRSSWVRATVSPLQRLGEPSPTRLAGVLEDVTRRKELEARLEKRGRELEQALARVRAAEEGRLRLLADVSHEMRNPLTGIVGLAGMLVESDLADGDLQIARILLSSGQGLLRLLEDLLDYSKLEVGVLTLEEKPMQVRALVEECVSLLGPRADDAEIRLRYEIEEGFPPRIVADVTRLRQVLLNFLANAVAHSGGKSVDVRVRRDAPGGDDGDTWILEVADTGEGIPKKVLDQLFTRFARGETKAEGSGLGLVISRRIVVAMGGRLDVDSEVGVGTTLRARLPLTVPAEAPGPVAALRADIGRGHRVLVADDDLVLQLLLQTYLRAAGFSVDIVSDGAPAVQKAREEEYSVVLLDTRMTSMDGVSAAREIRQSGCRAKILFVTAASEREKAECLEVGDAFLSKPFDRQGLVEAVASLLA